MSTKIYDGLIANSTDAFQVMRDIKSVLEPIYNEKFVNLYNIVKHHAIQKSTYKELNHDLTILGNESLKPEDEIVAFPDFTAYEIMEKLKNHPTRTFTDHDFGYDVVIIENGNKGENLLVLVFSSDRAYLDALLESNVVNEYGYWNNTDEPDDVTEEEWEKRKLAWDKLDVPKEDGLNFGNPSKYASMGIIYDLQKDQ